MARNEEKQQGRLNRLWLQKEREEGRLKTVHERRPKLATLNSVSSVKKWIPSIKNEIEYYLRQSQLSHYPERKISEFQLNIEALEKEYKRFIAKLRVLDPSCKHKPWTPRPYSKRRGDTPESPDAAKVPRFCEEHPNHSGWRESEGGLSSKWTGCSSTSDRSSPPSQSGTLIQDLQSKSSHAVCEDQDQPLSFDHTRLAVATAAFRGLSEQLGPPQTQNMVRVLQRSLPNLVGSASRRSTVSKNRDSVGADGETVVSSVFRKSEDKGVERIPGESPTVGTTGERAAHVLGLDCYSSSDENCDM